MLSYNRIRKISEMFDPSIPINENFHDHMVSLDDDMDWEYNTLNFPMSDFTTGLEALDIGRFDDEPLSPQSQIRNHDCMWSGRCTTHPNECLSSRNCNTKYMNENDMKKSSGPQTIQQQPQQIASNGQQTQQMPQHNQQIRKQQNIPAGRSLLKTKPSVIKVPNMSTNDFLKDRDYITRPDTPLSLDDDPPEFKHSIDLAACTMGSNKMSLITDSPTEIINNLKEHLEDINSNRVPKICSNYMQSISKGVELDEIMKDIQTFSDFEDDDEEADESDATNDSFNISNTMVTLPNTQSQASLLISSSIQNSTNENTQTMQMHMHSDHSYSSLQSRNKNRVDVNELGVQTPSDSGMSNFYSYLFIF